MKRHRIVLTRITLTALLLAIACGQSDGAEPSWKSLPVHLEGGIVVYGDSRSGHDEHRRIVEGIEHVRPLAVFHTGDLVNEGTDPGDWQIFDGITADLLARTAFYPALGNHERESDLYFDHFDLPGNERWYTVALPPMKFIVLDTESSLAVGSTQYQWLRSQLETADAGDALAAVFHYPPYSTGYHAEDEKGLRKSIVPLFEAYDVDVVFTGHDHDYERSLVNGVVYVVTGGGGGPLRGRSRSSPFSQVFASVYHFCALYVEEGKIMVDVWDSNVNLVDRFEVE
ncbi:MAG: metallophosphoesterase [bacterium]|nr:MAG: metallophosphoesterase [bacterium]